MTEFSAQETEKELVLALKSQENKQQERIQEKTDKTLRNMALSDFYAFIHFCGKMLDVAIEPQKDSTKTNRIFRLPEIAGGYFAIALSEEVETMISPTETQIIKTPPIIGSQMPFFTMLKWEKITIDSNHVITFHEDALNGVVFSFPILSDITALDLLEAKATAIGRFNPTENIITATQHNIPVIAV